MKMKYALTGGIGSGKSFVAKKLQERGIEVYDCDSAAKRLMHDSQDVKDQLIAAVGDEAYTTEGKLNKAVISRFLMASEANTQIINGIVHPAVAADFQQSGKQWLESAILFQCGFEKYVDKVVCVTAPLETRIQRIIQRDNITREQALQWINKQMSQEEIEQRSDYCIVNTNESNLETQIDKLLKLII